MCTTRSWVQILSSHIVSVMILSMHIVSAIMTGAHPFDVDHKGGVVALKDMAKSTCSNQLQWIFLFDSIK